jgi:hypothetical protein
VQVRFTMIPASPAMMAPPIKKQRAGNTPEDPIAARTESALAYRSERVQDLAQRYGTASRAHNQNGDLSSANVPSMMKGTAVGASSFHQSGAALRGGGRPIPSALRDDRLDPSVMRGSSAPVSIPISNKEFSMVPEKQLGIPGSQLRPPPPKPGTAVLQSRRTDAVPPPRQATANSSTKSSPISAKSRLGSPPDSVCGGDGAIARRLEESFQSNVPDSTRSKSAPPSRPPPPQGPPPSTRNESAKVVSFQIPQSEVLVSPDVASQTRTSSAPWVGKPPESTSTPDDNAMSMKNAGVTPFYSAAPPGATPFRATTESSTPPTTARRDLLRNMREFAETPQKPLTSPRGSAVDVKKSPELRFHEELASAEKEKAAALRQVAELQMEIAQIKSSHVNHVGFLSPVSNVISSPIQGRSRRIGTPHPKSKLPKPSTPTELDAERHWLMEATKRTPFEYDSENGTTLVVRRPHGCATEADWWYKAGQLPAKMYANTATVEFPSTIEVAVVIDADQSIFVLHGEGEVRHHSTVTGISTEYGNVDERSGALGSVPYVDKNALDREYSLDELYEYAVSVRGHYCTTIRSFAAALQLHPEPPAADASTMPTNTLISAPKVAVETVDKSVATDTPKVSNVTEESNLHTKTQQSAPLPPVDEDTSSDVLGSFIHLFFSAILGTIWFIVVKLPLRILTSTVVLAASMALLSYLWLYFVDENGQMEIAATSGMYFNRPGIV